MRAALRKESRVEQGNVRRPVNPRLRYQRKNPTHRARHGPSVPQCVFCKAHDMLRKARKHKSGGYKSTLDRWHDDDKYRNSLSDIGWTEEQIIQHDAIALEDHSYVATWQERSRKKSWNISFNAEGFQGPLNQRSDFIEAKQKCKRLYDEHTAITGDVKQTYPSWATS